MTPVSYDVMREYQAAVAEAIDQVPPPPKGDAMMQVFVLTDMTARFVAQVIIQLEIVEAKKFTADVLRLLEDTVGHCVHDARHGLIS